MDKKNALEKAVEIVGSQARLAAKTGVTPQFICQLLKGSRPIPASFALKIEAATDGQVSKNQLCPAIFGQPDCAVA